MARGIATAEMVIALGRVGCLGFFGAAGLSLQEVEAALHTISAALPDAPWGSNLIHSPEEPALEEALVDLYLRRGVRRISAAAYMRLSLPLLRYAIQGLHRRPDGRIQRAQWIFAKVSRPEVAQRFMSPPPEELLRALLERGEINAEEAALAATLPVAEDLSAEADSGGHTDAQALSALLPRLLGLRDELSAHYGYPQPLRVGAAGGLGTPGAVAAAFAAGAAYVLTGSINQSCQESGLHESGRRLLAGASLGDMARAPSADMFELGAEVQVLSRGSLFPVRARKLRALYLAWPSLEALPQRERALLEDQIFHQDLERAWEETAAWWQKRDPQRLAQAEVDPKQRMALLFRRYLGQSSRWAIAGDPDRRLDAQIWCGPAMGAFNAWVKGSFLEPLSQRQVHQIALNLLEGAAILSRAQQMRCAGAPIPAAAFNYRPRPLS